MPQRLVPCSVHGKMFQEKVLWGFYEIRAIYHALRVLFKGKFACSSWSVNIDIMANSINHEMLCFKQSVILSWFSESFKFEWDLKNKVLDSQIRENLFTLNSIFRKFESLNIIFIIIVFMDRISTVIVYLLTNYNYQFSLKLCDYR